MLVLNINFIIDFLNYAIEFVLLINGFKLYLENDLIAIEIVTIKNDTSAIKEPIAINLISG